MKYILSGLMIFSLGFIVNLAYAESNDNFLDPKTCEMLISLEQINEITNLESEDLFFRMINEDLTELNPDMDSGCVFSFENPKGDISIAILVAQYFTPEEAIEKRNKAMIGATTENVVMNEGVLENDWEYFILEINDKGLGILMNSYKDSLSVTYNVPIIGGKSQPVLPEHLIAISTIINSNLDSEKSKHHLFLDNKETSNSLSLSKSPLKQIKDGIPHHMVTCNDGRQPIIKTNGETIACVFVESKLKLIERGWGKLLEDTNDQSSYELCEEYGGKWIKETNECEYVSEEQCLVMNGTYSECESACRNIPEAEICTTQCVPVCITP